MVYTDLKNLIQEALDITADRVYMWRLIVEEYGPENIYIKGIHNTVADEISQLDYAPAQSHKKECQNWMTLTKCCCSVHSPDENTTNYEESMKILCFQITVKRKK